MATASHRNSLPHRLATVLSSTLLVAGLLASGFADVAADVGDQAIGNPAGLSITIESVDQLTGLTAVAVGGGEIPLLEEPAASAESLASIPAGSELDLRIDTVDTVLDETGNRWWPATWDETDGWVNGENLTQATTVDGEVISSTLVPFEYPRQATAHSTAQVFGNGEHVNVREEPSPTSTVLTRAADGQVVSLRIDLVDTVSDGEGTRWWPVTVNGIDGWISGFHLADSNDAPTTSVDEPVAPSSTATEPAQPGEAPTAPATSDDAAFAAGDFVQVFTGDGTSVNVRESASIDAPVVGTLSDGQVVEVVSGPVASDASDAGWYEVTAGGVTGFVDGDYLISSVEAPSGEPPLSTEPPLSEEEEATQRARQTPTPAATEAATSTPDDGETAEPAPSTTPRPTQAPTPRPTQIPTQESSADFILPLANYTRTQNFGCSNLGFYSYNAEYGCALHNGLDLAAASGTPIIASASGTVVSAGWCNCGLGYYVEIDHGDGVHTLYGHMRQQPSVAAGQQVSQGQQIGEVGSTGISTGPHVHFMVTVNGVARNPDNYV